MDDIFGVLVGGAHCDVSRSEKAAKRFATMNGYDIVTIRYNSGYIATEFAQKKGGKWVSIIGAQISKPTLNNKNDETQNNRTGKR